MIPPPSDDAKEEDFLVQCARAGDDNAFDQLYQRHRTALCGYVTRMSGSYEDAQQITQDIFIIAWQELSDLQSNTSFKSWLYGIATHRTLDWLRRRHRFEWLSWEEHTQILDLFDYSRGRCDVSPDEQVISREITKLALQNVTDSYRACLLLQIDVGLPQKEIASLLGISEKSVSVFVKRALQQYQKALGQIERDIQTDLEKRSK